MLNNNDREFIEQNIKELLELIDSKMALQMPLETNNDFMSLMCELMGATDWLFQSACILSKLNGLNRNQAIITGHLIRIRKLYRGMRIHCAEDRLELAIIFHRPIIETVVYMIYMVMNKSNPKTYESFIVTSYMGDRELLFFLQEQSEKRELHNIEKRMLNSIIEDLKRDQVSEDTLRNCNHSRVDGKNFKQILEYIEFSNVNEEYDRAYGMYRNCSRPIHVNWRDISTYDLIHKDGHYFPHIDFHSVGIGVASIITMICLGCLLTYIGVFETWNATHLSSSDKDRQLLDEFKSAIKNLDELIHKLESEHEKKRLD